MSRNKLYKNLERRTVGCFMTNQPTKSLATVWKPVLRIHDILVWIRIRGSMPLTNGSVSVLLQLLHHFSNPDPYLWLMDPDSVGPKTCGSGGSGSGFGSAILSDNYDDVILSCSRQGRGGPQHRGGLMRHPTNSYNNAPGHNNSIVLSPAQRRFRQATGWRTAIE